MAFPNEHAARIRFPVAGRKTSRAHNHFGAGRHAVFEVIQGKPRRTVLQSVRFDKNQHSPGDALHWLRGEGHCAVLFERSGNIGKRDELSADARDMVREGFDPDLTTRAFMLRQETIDAEKRTVDAIIASENPVAVLDFRSFEVIDEILLVEGIDVSGERVPLLDSHQRFSVRNSLGSTGRFNVEKSGEGKILAARNFFGRTQLALDAFSQVEDRHLDSFSVGYRVRAHVDIEPGESQTVNGRKFTAGQRLLRISVSSLLKENSLVTIGADETAKVK